MSVNCMPNALGKIAAEVMAGAGLKSSSVVHQRFDRVGMFRTGKLFLLRLLSFDRRMARSSAGKSPRRPSASALVRSPAPLPPWHGWCVLPAIRTLWSAGKASSPFPSAPRCTTGCKSGKIAVGVHIVFIKIAEQRLGCRTDAKALRQFLHAAVRDPRHFRRKPLPVALFFEEMLRDQHRNVHVFSRLSLKRASK